MAECIDRVLTVSLHGIEAGFGRGLVATFPRSLRIVRAPCIPDIAIIDGRSNWICRAQEQLREGTRRLLVIDPMPVDAEGAERLIDELGMHGAQLCLADAVSGNPALPALRELLQGHFDEVVVVARAPGESAAILLSCLRLLRAIGLSISKADYFVSNGRAFLGEVHIPEEHGAEPGKGMAVRFNGTVCEVGNAEVVLRARRADAEARYEFVDLAPGFPARVTEVTPEGIRQLPAIYEGSARHELREMLRLGNKVSNEQLAQFIEDLRTVKNLL